jgi:argininosuccinate lyase
MVTNTYRAISSAQWLTRPAAALEELLRDYTRIAADLLHKASSEVGIVSFPDSLIQISSIMSQKRNPVIIEHIRIQAGLAAAASASVCELMRNVPYQDVNEASDAPVSVLIDSLAMASSATVLLREALLNVRPNDERVRRIALDFGVTTTELADTLVRREGIGFRDAHAACSAFAGSGGDKAALRAAFAERCGRDLTLSDAEIEEALSPEGFVAVRKVPGGPAPEGMAPVLGELDSWAADCAASIAAIDARNEKAGADLAEAWARIVA